MKRTALFIVFLSLLALNFNYSTVKAERTPSFPFIWFEDSFDQFNETIWQNASCIQVDSGRITIDGFYVSPCSLAPNLTASSSEPSWALPIGATIESAAITLYGGSFPKSYCCTPAIELGVANFTYARTVPGPSGSPSYNCSVAGVCTTVTSQCFALTATMTETWKYQTTTLASIGTQVCAGDKCACGARYDPSARLPSSNFTTVVVADAATGLSKVSLPGLTGQYTVPSSAIPLNSSTLSWIKVSLVNTLSACSTGGFYVYDSGRPNRALPSAATFDGIEVLFPGQCYDGNSVSGDGCNDGYVEPFCQCRRNGDTWGKSICICVTSSEDLVLFTNTSSISVLDPTDTPYPTSGQSNPIEIPFNTRDIVTFSNCVHPSLNCSNSNPNRHLAMVINGTLVLGGETPFVSSAQLSVNISAFGVPFPIGTTIQFYWWSNVRPGVPAGLFALDGPVVAVSPVFRVAAWSPQSFPSSPTIEYVGGFTYNISFTSPVRTPDFVEMWLYQGIIPYSQSLHHNFTEGADLTPLSILSCEHSASGAVLHTCQVVVSEPMEGSPISYLVARVTQDASIGTINSIAKPVVKQPLLHPVGHAVPRDSALLKLNGDFLHSDANFWVTANGTLIDFYWKQRNYTFIEVGLATLMDSDSHILVWWELHGMSSYYDVSITFQSPPTINPQYSTRFYYDNATITITGVDFVADDLAPNHVILSQPGVPGASPKIVLLSAFENKLVVRLTSRLATGAVSTVVSVYEGSPSVETFIGFFTAESLYDKEQYPNGIDLSVVPLLSYRINATGIQDGPSRQTLDHVKASLAAVLNLTSSDLYTRLLWTKDTGTAYELRIWFVSDAAAKAFNQWSVSSNITVLESVKEAVDSSTFGLYDCALLSATVSIDSDWPYLKFQLNSTTRELAPTAAELAEIVNFLKLFWQLDRVDLHAAAKASGSSGQFYLTIYFRTTAAQQLFLTKKLPRNAEVTGGVIDSLIGSATNDLYQALFVEGSALPEEQFVINVDWPWLKYRLTPMGTLSGYPNATSAVGGALDLCATLLGLKSTDLHILVKSLNSSSKRRAYSDTFDLTLFFTTAAALGQFDLLSLPDNTTIINGINQININTFLYNSTFIGSNRNSRVIASNPTSLGWREYLGIAIAVIAVVAFFIIFAVFYRKKFREIWNAQRSALKVPENMAAMFSIKASQIDLGEKIGEGSFGSVYKGVYQGQIVAVKKLAANVLASHVSDFFSEASLMLGIDNHPNVIRTYGMCQELGNFSMVMEYLPGGSLETLCKSVRLGNPLSEELFYKIARGVALGMRHIAHSRIVHRDLAARNVLLGACNVPKVADFGFSRVVGEEKVGKTTSLIGPVRWMAPENLAIQEYSEKSDVWAYGALLIEMITGDVPFPGQELLTVAVHVRDRQGTALDFVPKDAPSPKWALELVRMCFRFDPTARPSFDDIVEFLTSHSPSPNSNEDDVGYSVASSSASVEDSDPPQRANQSGALNNALTESTQYSSIRVGKQET